MAGQKSKKARRGRRGARVHEPKEGNTTMTSENDFSQTTKDVPTVEVTLKYLDALRMAVGRHIDPETAEVKWIYAQTLDPYGDDRKLPEECRQVGREYFARSPESDLWIFFGHLPDATRDALWKKHKSRLAFPAGLEFMLFANRYLEQHFGDTSNISDDEFNKAMTAAQEAYLAEKNEREERL
jgi:hypothetical protein